VTNIEICVFVKCSNLLSVNFSESFVNFHEHSFFEIHSDLCLFVQTQEQMDAYQTLFPEMTIKYNYMELAKKRTRLLKEELIQEYMHPLRVQRFLECGGDLDEY